MSGDSEVAFECVVSAELFRRAHMGISKEETRYYLNGVHISPAAEGGATIVATDGSILICMHDPDAYVQGEAIVKLDKLMVSALAASGYLIEQRLLAVRVMAGHTKPRAFVVDQRRPAQDDEFKSAHLAARTVFDDPDRRVRAAQFAPLTIDGNFPNWRGVLPTDLDINATIGVFDERKLATLGRALTLKGGHSLRLTGSRENPRNSPVLVTGSSVIRGFAILMPLPETPPASVAVPTWALLPAQPKAA